MHRIMRIAAISVLQATFFVGQCAAKSAVALDATPPPALKSYKGRTIAVTMHSSGAGWLVRGTRQREEDCETMLGELRIEPGMTVCDMGCGNGYYTLRLAEMVGETGEVIAVDIQQEMLRMLESRAEKAGYKNIRPTLGAPFDPGLPTGAIDLILCVDVYHEFSHPEQMLQAMRKSLKPNGQIVLLEFRAEDRNVPIKRLHKMSKRQVKKELLPNGFRLTREFDGLPWQHMMFFGK